uniref:peptidylprolyl isomerase n=1 Tax=Rhodosorus marinus TaxID=101924 RepID=A0A7S0G061_9RHOD|mmetsp:Transcript_15892/g.23205  ORF Transcript_15892/g.23205 Transcript_15892/m.23205 type:complete len:205 (+) Transcript_15892:105-719(+)
MQAFCSVTCGLSHSRAASETCSRRDLLRVGMVLVAGSGLGLLAPGSDNAKAASNSLEFLELRALDDSKKESRLPEFRKLADGVKVQDIAEGEGPSVEDGSRVAVHYVIRRSNGYFVDASYGFDRFDTFSFTSGSGDVIKGFDIGTKGMKPGGRRRFLVSPDQGYKTGTSKTSPGPIPPDWGNRRALSAHASEPLLFEVQVVKIR